MRRLIPLAVLSLAGCSTAPITNLMDRFRPSRPGDGDPAEPAPPPPRSPGGGRIPPPGLVPLGDPGPPPRPSDAR